jgi:tRNA threonylcarbamoyl adenosine modification protein YeaZ
MTETAPLHLAFDTGSPWVSVALARGGAPVAVRAAVMERSSNQVLEMMRAVLAEGGARPADLDGIVALRGPGSFTGVRIGLATALGFHQSLGVAAMALSTFEALAAAVEPEPGSILIAAVDALRGDQHVQAFRGGDLQPLAEPELVPSAEIPALFDRLGGGRRILAGFGLDRLAGLADRPTDIHRFEPGPDRPLAVVAARLAALPGAVWDPGLLIAPLYSRPPAITLPKARPKAQMPPAPR